MESSLNSNKSCDIVERGTIYESLPKNEQKSSISIACDTKGQSVNFERISE
jgi:hypothetical protein